ncbi:hypothetical protein [Maledivibacter halophilus]|uniref:Uncharacterized protein n=1 Tax=Maledivibacter halophilus TaxID=36842 RepID=A0A1T5KFV5_9FIRM|nr:hypothetical protein [Maledivibacter halophilus]SKC62540.1 hypothetical protein SAMN02194393_01763 [Maledivibacter halophilus]
MPQTEDKGHDCIEDETKEDCRINFDFWYYIATNFLNMNEEIFWKSTIRKLNSLYKIYRQVNGLENRTNKDKYDKCYCDDIDWL